MNKMQMQVAEFHSYYHVPILGSPDIPDQKRIDLRIELIREEFRELCFACGVDMYTYIGKVNKPHLVDVADALGDLLYVVFGSALEFGLDMEPIFDEIQRSNMSKLGDNGKPIYASNGKVLKGPHWFPPDIARIIAKMKADAYGKG